MTVHHASADDETPSTSGRTVQAVRHKEPVQAGTKMARDALLARYPPPGKLDLK